MHVFAYNIFKVILTAMIIVVVSEIAKVNTILGAMIKSLPLISLLSICWLYIETGSLEKVASFSKSTFWFVLPTLPMFLIFPALLRYGLGCWLSLLYSIVLMLMCYGITLLLLRYFQVQL
ncbi:MAG: DUF3147 family protein [Chthoniobacterales bacterium]|nr:DUF3147 family protein [Chthoniobacterales bacterium]